MAHDDADTVKACEKILDEADTLEQLKEKGLRLAKETLSEKDAGYLRQVYKDCHRAIVLFETTDTSWMGLPHGRCDTEATGSGGDAETAALPTGGNAGVRTVSETVPSRTKCGHDSRQDTLGFV